MTRRPINLSLYLVLDPQDVEGRSAEEVLRMAVTGGVTAVQLRTGGLAGDEMLPLAQELRRTCREAGVAFILCGAAEHAVEVDADGVHLPFGEASVPEVRALIGEDRIIGVTIEREDEVESYCEQGVQYMMCRFEKGEAGTCFSMAELERLARLCTVPVVPSGGVTPENADDVMKTGVAGLAVNTAVTAAEDPKAAARDLRHVVDRFPRSRTPKLS